MSENETCIGMESPPQKKKQKKQKTNRYYEKLMREVQCTENQCAMSARCKQTMSSYLIDQQGYIPAL